MGNEIGRIVNGEWEKGNGVCEKGKGEWEKESGSGRKGKGNGRKRKGKGMGMGEMRKEGGGEERIEYTRTE